MGDNISPVEGIQYCGGIPSVLWGANSSTCGGYPQYCGGCSAGDSFSTVEVAQYSGDNISTVEDASVLWRVFITLRNNISTCGEDNISTVGDNISTVEGIQYSGRRILILSCLVINNDEKISTFFVLRYEIFIRNFFKIQADFFINFRELDWCTPSSF